MYIVVVEVCANIILRLNTVHAIKRYARFKI